MVSEVKALPPLLVNGDGDAADAWKLWLQRFTIFLRANGHDNAAPEKQVAMFLHLIGEECLHIFNSFGNPKRPFVKKPTTTGTQFKISVDSLMKNLSSKQLHYVRCIRPNQGHHPKLFETGLVQHQVKYLGLLETVRIRRSGFCYRLPYEHFVSRYKLLSPRTWPFPLCSPIEAVHVILHGLPIPHGEFAFGRSKLFVRSPRS
ncbi:unconventional myosin-Ia-like, partial [Diaphorina citri]|uniref:Unconventional myosin-Ia-like n=1 Tax=Diaphorina citri TaxID=121845 RepID=A0A1S3DN83_DIACI